MNQTKYIDNEKNCIRFSNFKKLETECPFTGLGVKYVASGEEIYYANDKKYKVNVGEYIIGNEFTKSIVQIDHKEIVQGLCIDISSEIISEVAEFHDVNGTELKEFLLSDQFFVNRYDVKNTRLGYSLNEINQQIKNGIFSNDLQHSELFYSLAESIITDQRFVFDHLSKLYFKKNVTNEGIFRAILQAKLLIDENITDNLSLEKIARQIGISKYHFIRVFKAAFGISPYQYQKRKRLELAKLDLLKGNEILFTAIRFGFPDAPTFTKAFKQQFGLTPGSLKKSNF
ncbi:MAG: helix-turn-helix domain-containing protein [Sphingobacteriaceae bacterium]